MAAIGLGWADGAFVQESWITGAWALVPAAPAPPPQVAGGGGDPSPFDFKEMHKSQAIREDRELLLVIRQFLDKAE